MGLALAALIFLTALLIGAYVWLRNNVLYHVPENYPNPERKAPGKLTVVCAGDSITHGNTGADYVAMLDQRHPDWQCFNAGRNADLTDTLLARLDDVIRVSPDVVTVLIGTNDVNATMGTSQLHEYRRINRIGPAVTPDFAQFQANYRQLIHRLKTETPAHIAVASLPVMGEDLTHEVNRRADQYSAFIKALAEEQQVTYLPVREAMKTYLTQFPAERKHRYEQARLLLTLSVARHYLLGESWDRICARHGNLLTQDMLHFNTAGATIIADEITQFLSSAAPPAERNQAKRNER